MGIKGHLIIFMITSIMISAAFLPAEELQTGSDEILAEYLDGKITRADFEEEFENIPMMYRSRFSTLAGQQELLNSIVTTNIFYHKAQELGIDQREDVRENLVNALQNHYAMEYRKRDISEKIEISEEDIENYYNNNQDRFKESQNTVIRYIMPENPEDAAAAKEALLKGEDFTDVMNRYSINSFSKRHQGVIRNIRGNGYIAGVGMDDELDGAISEAEENTWVGPLTTESGIHIFRITERRPARIKPLAEVEAEIRNRLAPVLELEKTETVYNELKEKYDVAIDKEALEEAGLGLSRPDPESVDKVVVSAGIPELELTIGDIGARFQGISPQERSQMVNPEHRDRLIDEMIKNNLFAYEAKRKGYDTHLQDNPEVHHIRRNVILTELFNELVIAKAQPTPEEVEAFYQENIDRFTRQERRSVQLFVFDSRRAARRARRQVSRAIDDDDQEKIEEIIGNSLYTENSGLLTNIMRESNIPGIGEDDKIQQVIWETQADELSDINQNDAGEYFFLRVTEAIPARTQPLAEAEEKITVMLTRELREKVWNDLQADMKDEYEVVIYPDRLALMKSARDLFDLAEDAMKRNRYAEAIEYYDQIIEHHNNNDDDYKALFMKAFVLAEELQRTEEAISLFRNVLDDYPDSDLHESAEYMIKALEEGYDTFEELD